MKKTIGIILLAWLIPAAAVAQTCTGKVLRVVDGDTVWMMCDGHKVKVRLAQIDAPETAHPRWHKKGQPGGPESRRTLIHLIGGGLITLEYEGKDRYGRIVGELYRGDKDLNLIMVARGEAWAYDRYVVDDRIFDAEERARAAHLGLWRRPNHEAPWEFRHRNGAL